MGNRMLFLLPWFWGAHISNLKITKWLRKVLNKTVFNLIVHGLLFFVILSPSFDFYTG
jgi:hypothetical protein